MWWTRWTRGKDLISLREKGGEGGTRVYNTRDGGEGGGVCFSLSLSLFLWPVGRGLRGNPGD